MTSQPSRRELTATTPVVQQRLDQVVRRIRLLRTAAGVGRLLTLVALALPLLYALDRLLVLPLPVRAVVALVLVVLLGRETWRRLLRPLVAGPDRLDAARMVERALDFEGRLVAALQLPAGEPGSLEQAVAQETAAACERVDLRVVLTSRPSLVEVLRGVGALAALALAIVLVEPHADVFGARWSLREVPWPRDTHLLLELPPGSSVHVVAEDGGLIAARGGLVSVGVGWEGLRPQRVELLVEGADGTRRSQLSAGAGGRFAGHLTVEAGDRSLTVMGGDDDGSEHVLPITVVEPPRLDDPVFVLQPPAYIDEPERRVGAEGLVVAEGTSVGVEGRASGPATEAVLWRLASGESVPLVAGADGLLRGSFVADQSDTLSVHVTGEYGLATPDPAQHPLLVHQDRPPTLRVYAPARSDVKVTAQALVPVAVVAADDHGVGAVELLPGDGAALPLTGDGGTYRTVLDMAAMGLTDSLPYALEVSDRRDLGERGPQRVRVDGRRVAIVEPAEVQRLLADRQLRLKENYLGLRERQLRAAEALDDLIVEPPAADDPELITTAIAQNQVSTRLGRESRELCSVLEETLLNRLDGGPGGGPLLERYLELWARHPVEEPLPAAVWSELAREHADGRFGRLDVVDRLLGMAELALGLTGVRSPRAHELLLAARATPDVAHLRAARDAQQAVLDDLDKLLQRMDEWEDYQEVLTLVKALIDDQRALRERSQQALAESPGDN